MTIPEIKKKWQKKEENYHSDYYDITRVLMREFIKDLDTLPECKTDHHNEALNLLMNLSNFGAEFNDEKMAVDLITEALKRTNECNGLKIDYTKETCTSCGCKNHDQ